MPVRILSVSYDDAFLSTRELLLKSRGYQVTSALGFTQAVKKCSSDTRFDLFILGHSIPHSDKEALIEAFRAKCPAPILALDRPGEPSVVGADFEIEPNDPSKLLELVERIVADDAAGA